MEGPCLHPRHHAQGTASGLTDPASAASLGLPLSSCPPWLSLPELSSHATGVFQVAWPLLVSPWLGHTLHTNQSHVPQNLPVFSYCQHQDGKLPKPGACLSCLPLSEADGPGATVWSGHWDTSVKTINDNICVPESCVQGPWALGPVPPCHATALGSSCQSQHVTADQCCVRPHVFSRFITCLPFSYRRRTYPWKAQPLVLPSGDTMWTGPGRLPQAVTMAKRLKLTARGCVPSQIPLQALHKY